METAGEWFGKPNTNPEPAVHIPDFLCSGSGRRMNRCTCSCRSVAFRPPPLALSLDTSASAAPATVVGTKRSGPRRRRRPTSGAAAALAPISGFSAPASLWNPQPSPLIGPRPRGISYLTSGRFSPSSLLPSLIRRRQASTFVSKHYALQLTVDQVQAVLPPGAVCQENSTHILVKECPLCGKPTHGRADNHFKLYIQKTDGAFFCHRCGAGGSWYDFKQRLRGHAYPLQSIGQATGLVPLTNASWSTSSSPAAAAPTTTTTTPPSTKVPCLPMPHPKLPGVYAHNLWQQKATNGPVYQYLVHTRGLEEGTLLKYGVGQAKYKFVHPQTNQWVFSDWYV